MGLINALGSIGTSILNNYAEDKRAQKQREWSEQMMDKENEWSLEMWNRTNQYNDPSQQVARLTNAGLNPLYYGLDGSSANGLESAQPLNYERASTQGIANPVEAYMQGETYKRQLELLEAQKENVDADTDQKKTETTGYELDNEFKRKTMDARVQAEDLANDLTRRQVKKIDSEVEKIGKEIKEIEARTDNELAKKFLIDAETNLKKMEADQIAELLPYQKLFYEAQTAAQKASAAASLAKAAYDRGLIDKGYIDAMVADLKAKARTENAKAAADEWINAIHNGTLYGGSDSAIGKAGDWLANQVTGSLSVIGEVLKPFASLIGIGIGAAGIKGAVGKSGKSGNWFERNLTKSTPNRRRLPDPGDWTQDPSSFGL